MWLLALIVVEREILLIGYCHPSRNSAPKGTIKIEKACDWVGGGSSPYQGLEMVCTSSDIIGRLGGVVVSVLATVPKGCGFKTWPRRWIYNSAAHLPLCGK
jgi:hypothetical protein